MTVLSAVVWSDYVCPWCWLGRSQTELLESLGVVVETRPFELHPDLPPEGRAVRADGRLAAVYERIGAACAELGRPFRPPTRVGNSRRALETAEVVRAVEPAAYAAIDDELFRAVFVDGRDVSDRDTLADLVQRVGLSGDAIGERVDAGGGRGAVDASRGDALEHGISATPSWLVGDRLVIPGVQPQDTVTRWVTRLQERLDDQVAPAAQTEGNTAGDAPAPGSRRAQSM